MADYLRVLSEKAYKHNGGGCTGSSLFTLLARRLLSGGVPFAVCSHFSHPGVGLESRVAVDVGHCCAINVDVRGYVRGPVKVPVVDPTVFPLTRLVNDEEDIGLVRECARPKVGGYEPGVHAVAQGIVLPNGG